jgi:hypothetical protein
MVSWRKAMKDIHAKKKPGLFNALKENALAWDMAQTLSALYAQRKPLAANDDDRNERAPAQVDWSRTELTWGLASA